MQATKKSLALVMSIESIPDHRSHPVLRGRARLWVHRRDRPRLNWCAAHFQQLELRRSPAVHLGRSLQGRQSRSCRLPLPL
jgi:hypothetical protein